MELKGTYGYPQKYLENFDISVEHKELYPIVYGNLYEKRICKRRDVYTLYMNQSAE